MMGYIYLDEKGYEDNPPGQFLPGDYKEIAQFTPSDVIEIASTPFAMASLPMRIHTQTDEGPYLQ